jgi:hypothetical protein
MGSFISSLNDFAVKGITWAASVLKDGKGLNKTADTSANLAVNSGGLCVPSSGSLKTALVTAGAIADSADIGEIYDFLITTNSSGTVFKVSVKYKNLSKAALLNETAVGKTIIFDAASLEAGIGAGAGTPAGSVTVTLDATDVIYPDSTKFWNNECVSVYVGGAAGNIVGVLANDNAPITIPTAANAGFLEFAFKSIDSASTTSGSLILVQ